MCSDFFLGYHIEHDGGHAAKPNPKIDCTPMQVPGNFLYSDKFDLIAKRDVQELSWVHRNIKFSPVSGGHFFPLTRPEYAAEKILEILDNPPN